MAALTTDHEATISTATSLALPTTPSTRSDRTSNLSNGFLQDMPTTTFTTVPSSTLPVLTSARTRAHVASLGDSGVSFQLMEPTIETAIGAAIATVTATSSTVYPTSFDALRSSLTATTFPPAAVPTNFQYSYPPATDIYYSATGSADCAVQTNLSPLNDTNDQCLSADSTSAAGTHYPEWSHHVPWLASCALMIVGVVMCILFMSGLYHGCFDWRLRVILQISNSKIMTCD